SQAGRKFAHLRSQADSIKIGPGPYLAQALRIIHALHDTAFVSLDSQGGERVLTTPHRAVGEGENAVTHHAYGLRRGRLRGERQERIALGADREAHLKAVQ